jgi:hypothetical protein
MNLQMLSTQNRGYLHRPARRFEDGMGILTEAIILSKYSMDALEAITCLIV